MAYTDWSDHGNWSDHDDHEDAAPYSDWTDYDDHHDHSDSDCQYTDWVDHTDGGHGDHDDHGDGPAHSDWDNHSDHSDGVHDDWDDAHDDWTDSYLDWDDAHTDWDDAHEDWTNAHDDWTDSYIDWTDAYTDWGDAHEDWTDAHTDWTDAHSDWGDGAHADSGGGVHQNWTDVHDDHDDVTPHTNWGDGHTDWDDHTDWTDGHVDWGNYSDAGSPHIDWQDGAGHANWSDAHSDWGDHNDGGDPHTDWDNHSDAGDPHIDWTDGHTDWDDYDDSHTNWTDAHTDWTDHDDGGGDPHADSGGDAHADWTNHSDAGGPHIDWHDGAAHQDWDDAHADWTNHSDAGSPHIDWHDGVAHEDWTNAHQDWTDHGDYGDYEDDGPHIDWDDHSDGAYTDWSDHSDLNNPHIDWTDGAHNDWTDHTDWTNHTDAGSPHIDWGDGGAHSDHTDGGPHEDWTDNYIDWTDAHSDWDDAHSDWGDSHGDWTDYTDWDDAGIPVGKTHISGWIGGKDVSCYILGADIWRDALNGIGRWELVLDNQGHWWGGAFSVYDPVTIHINGSLMMMGYVDDISPYIDSKGEYTEYIKINGRDYGMDLAQLYITQEYAINPATGVQWLADDIVEDAVVVQAGSEISYNSPSAVGGGIDYEFDRTYLTDGVRDIAKLVNYDFYVQDDVNRTLHFFDIATMGAGAEHTTVDLTSIPGSATNNILRLEVGENIGFEVKNIVEAHAGDLRDHYTDINAVDWVRGGVNVAVTDDVFRFVSGKGAIRMTATAGATSLFMTLEFPQYDHVSFDMSEPGEGHYAAYVHYTVILMKPIRIRLRDVASNWIEWYSLSGWPLPGARPAHKTTDNARNAEWRFIDFDYGDNVEIKAAGTTESGFWRYVGAAVAFDWTQVDRIRFTADPLFPRNNGDYAVIDQLSIPAIEVISIQQDAPSIALHGIRMKEVYRPDLKNQMELDAFVTNQLLKYSDPIQSVKITAIGQVDSNYAAQSLDVQAPSSGIGTLLADVAYRIFTLHHSVKLSPLNNEIMGYDYITEYELVRHQIDAVDQPIEPTRAIRSSRPTEAIIRNLREEQRYRKTIRTIRG